MRCPPEREVDQIGQGKLGPPSVQMARGELPAKDRGHLEVDQFRRGQVLAAEPRPGLVTVPPVVCERDGEDTRVNDEHVRTEVSSPTS